MPHAIYNEVASIMYTTAVEFNLQLQCTMASTMYPGTCQQLTPCFPVFNVASHYTHVYKKTHVPEIFIVRWNQRVFLLKYLKN